MNSFLLHTVLFKMIQAVIILSDVDERVLYYEDTGAYIIILFLP